MKRKKNNIKTLDLHGNRQDEVYDAIDAFLMKNSNQKRLRIMTGKGQGVVQKTTLKYLQQAGYPWQYETLANGKENKGCLIIFND